MAQLAGTQITRAAVHLIETGKVKPSLPTLRLIARRTQRPLEYFLMDPARELEGLKVEDLVEELRLLSAQRRSQDALPVADELLELSSDPEVQALARFHQGQALCRLIRPAECLQPLRDARAHFEQSADPWMVVDCLDWESSALFLLDDPEGLTLAEDALHRARQLRPAPQPTIASILGHLASMHRSRQEWTLAVRCYEQAVEAAGAVRDLQLLARLYDDLADAYQKLGHSARALELIRQAISLYSIESDLSAAFRAENNLGDILMQQGRLDAAEPHFQKALEGAEALGLDRRGRAYILANLGELNLRRGRPEAARDYLGRAFRAAEGVDERVILGHIHTLLGRLANESGDPSECDLHFAQAFDIYAPLQMPDRLRRSQMAYAEILDSRGDHEQAGRHWREAALLADATAAARAARAEEDVAAG
jgi:tetratricopeptide (TPR) repeat protein